MLVDLYRTNEPAGYQHPVDDIWMEPLQKRLCMTVYDALYATAVASWGAALKLGLFQLRSLHGIDGEDRK